MKQKTPTQKQEERQEKADKLNKLELAYAEKRLSEKDYVMWKKVYSLVPEERNYATERRAAMSNPQTRRRNRSW